ncbi:MAG: ABC transporter ATP-binding protein, partial [Clostridia bacterium]|nr:ABC transporter ATP-binding protein [Clostridia bacterium]
MKNIFKYLKPYKWQTLLAITLVLLESVFQLIVPRIMAEIVNVGIVNSDMSFILKRCVLIFVFSIAEIIMVIIAAYCAAKVSMDLGRDMRSTAFNKVNDFALYEVDKIGSASIITRITSDVTQVQTMVYMLLRMVIRAPILCVGGIVMATITDIKLSGILLISLPLLALTIGITAKRAIPLFSSMQTKTDDLNRVIREKLIGLRIIRAFNKSEYEEKRFEDKNKSLTDTSIKVQLIMSSLLPVIMLIMNLTTVAIVFFSSYRVNAFTLQVGTITAFIEYALMTLISLTFMALIFVMLPRAIVCANRVEEIVSTEISIKDNGVHAKVTNGEICFNNVSTRYYGSDNDAVSGITFTAKKGEVTAIVGGTGSGKSTILNMIMRFYEATKGEITIDGSSIKDIDLKTLRDNIGYAPQKAVLFSGDVESNLNIRGAKKEDIKAALKIADAEFINDEGGLQAEVSQGGTNFSGGQKQRLCIARAISTPAKIYLFDD